MTKRFELRLCSNGTYYVYENGTLTDIDFDKFNKENAYALIDEVNALYEEKEKLKQRNNRQYEQLSRLYNLIEQKEWRVLTDIIDNFKKSDEQLQKEWETYGDVE